MNYYISDLHFGCQNSYENRRLEHDEIIKEKWNNRVTNGDTVYVLGDIGKEGSNKDNEYLCSIISKLKGRKVLIKGNHDKLKDYRLKQLFSEIVDYKEVCDNSKRERNVVVLSHYPMLIWNGQHKGWVHLYGHVHMSEEWDVYKKALSSLDYYFAGQSANGREDCPPAVAYNVGCMLHDYEPKTLSELLSLPCK